MKEVTRLARSANTDAVIAALEETGGVVIEDFVDAATLDGLKSDLLPLMEGKATGRDAFSGDKTRRMGALFAHTRHVADVVTHPLFLPVAEHFIDRPVANWAGEDPYILTPGLRVGVTQAIQIGPGQGAQPLHRDDTVFLWRHPTYGREARLQIMLAISDFTAENGGTLVVPGSHKWDDDRAPKMTEAVSTVMKAGSALLFLGSCYHGGGNNRTDGEFRTGLTMSLDAANLRQEENMYLALPSEIVASYPEKVQRLLGWSAGEQNMGWVEIDGQMADPIHLLKEADGPVTGVSIKQFG